jgi:hypothetical protein
MQAGQAVTVMAAVQGAVAARAAIRQGEAKVGRLTHQAVVVLATQVAVGAVMEFPVAVAVAVA